MFKPGQSGNPTGRPKNKNGKPGSAHTLAALARLRREPVAELIKIADASENNDLKISLWKYLLERRDEGIALIGPGIVDIKADLDALERGDSKPVAPSAS